MSEIERIVDNLKFMENKYTGRYTERLSIGLMAHDCKCAIESLCDKIEELQSKNQELQKHLHNFKSNITTEKFFVTINYGTLEPFVASLWRMVEDKMEVVKEVVSEYYYCGKKAGHLMTDEEYYVKVKELIGNFNIEHISIDPSAASFLECVKRHGEFIVKKR